MELKVGDIVEFKKYEDLSVDDNAVITKEELPKSGKVKKIIFGNEKVIYFFIEGSPYSFSAKSIARVISDVDDCDYDLGVIRKGDEVLVKATVKEVFNGFVQINSSVDKTDITKILKRKSPERFIVQDDKYGMYIIGEGTLSYDKSKAKIYNSRIEANNEAADMHLNTWDVIPYDD